MLFLSWAQVVPKRLKKKRGEKSDVRPSGRRPLEYRWAGVCFQGLVAPFAISVSEWQLGRHCEGKTKGVIRCWGCTTADRFYLRRVYSKGSPVRGMQTSHAKLAEIDMCSRLLGGSRMPSERLCYGLCRWDETVAGALRAFCELMVFNTDNIRRLFPFEDPQLCTDASSRSTWRIWRIRRVALILAENFFEELSSEPKSLFRIRKCTPNQVEKPSTRIVYQTAERERTRT